MGCHRHLFRDPEQSDPSCRMEGVYKTVAGMWCSRLKNAACARRVEKALSGTADVRAANVNLAAEKATGEFSLFRLVRRHQTLFLRPSQLAYSPRHGGDGDLNP